MADKEITLFDPETQQSYTLILSAEDHSRAISDVQFAQKLLTYAYASGKNITPTTDITNQPEPEQETNYYDDIDEDSLIPEPENKEEDETNSSSNGNARMQYSWPYDQVVELINTMGNYLEDFNHPKKRKQVFELAANDLISMRFEVTAIMVQNKWKSLVKSYRKVKDNKTRTGRGPSRFHFFEQMDEILGTNPANSCSHSINASDVASTSDASDRDTPQPEPDVTPKTSKQTDEQDKSKLSDKKIKRDYVLAKKEEYSKRQKRHDEKLEIERMKLEMEKKKLELLEKFLGNKD